ncbi:hypothetical protein RAB80_015298 [Fusarium oxysporum f. sp. vasinfectum]|uniref:Uncharacterized protein n=1 Tax=Fusarium oxysporum f. sp. vasinfectum 25433 TaxID=1089449 RepID=X0KSF3_FUSOX|nr:hypothetical protein FOTG_15191 [Fusarium oxysporum f. sp. vasinfectum 25433]KAK2669772.1 hypothetical protein RAB80_015298 [Fusarium oxysporum f. sp. vasinfectum]KAK2686209.1 hypothetical protein QWA68_015808 [Fusarium oxysporum]KAK2925287.1 hypothetical protein FoTM2_015567 [Fusarium oxysporum f. sp. vasinfectum]
MSFAKNPPPDPGGQPNRLNQAKAADDYWAEADEIIARLTDTLKDRPETDDLTRRADAAIWWMKLVSLRLKFSWVMHRFQQDHSIGPTLRAMLRGFLKLDPLEGLLPDEGMSSEAFPAGEEMRNRLKILTEAVPESEEDMEQRSEQIATYASIYIWFLSQIKEEIEMEKSEPSFGAPSTDHVLRSNNKT